MREILFRGFHPCKDGEDEISIDCVRIKGKWVEGDFRNPCHITYTKFEFDKALRCCKEVTYDDYVIPETVRQFTGLCDADGKKIFERDILEYADSDGTLKRIIVVFDECAFLAQVDGVIDATLLTSYSCLGIRVIGKAY